jgi:hypothetical protein
MIPDYKGASQDLNASRVAVGQRISCCEHFVRQLDWMNIPELKKKDGQPSGPIFCPKANC